jgi:hypothetical protein
VRQRLLPLRLRPLQRLRPPPLLLLLWPPRPR